MSRQHGEQGMLERLCWCEPSFPACYGLDTARRSAAKQGLDGHMCRGCYCTEAWYNGKPRRALGSGADLGQEVGADGDEGNDGQREEEAGNGDPGDAVDHQQVHQLKQRERRHCAEGHSLHIWRMALLQQPAYAALQSSEVIALHVARHGSTLPTLLLHGKYCAYRAEQPPPKSRCWLACIVCAHCGCPPRDTPYRA